jgi:hypothetical protein
MTDISDIPYNGCSYAVNLLSPSKIEYSRLDYLVNADQ